MSTNETEISIALIRDNSQYISLERNKRPYIKYAEFPGGKSYHNESPELCLEREIYEELGIKITKYKYLGTIKHLYDNLLVKINIFKIFKYIGNIISKEDKKIVYYNIEKNIDALPTQNRILKLLKLPRIIKILTNDDYKSNQCVNYSCYGAIRLRGINYDFYLRNIKKKLISQRYSGKLIIDYQFSKEWHDPYDGIHYPSDCIDELDNNKIDSSIIHSASCHTINDIKSCNKKLYDFILISPVKNKYTTYESINWDGFAALSREAYMPTYALGGISSKGHDYRLSINNQGFGISGISFI